MLSACAFLVGVLAVQQHEATAHGDVALFGKVIEALPEGQLFGSSVWCEASEDSLLEFRSTPTPEALEVLASFTMPGFHWEWVRLHLSESGAKGEAFFAMDVGMDPLRDLAGVAILLTDGKDSVLEFEVTCSQGTYDLRPHYGRVHVGAEGVALAKALAARALTNPCEPFHERRSNEWLDEEHPERRITARGYVDSWGRRQGPWLYSDASGRTLLETTWRDGRASGPLTCFDEQGIRRRAETRLDGLLEGVSQEWSADGSLRAQREYHRGKLHGWSVIFAPDGTKDDCGVFKNGQQTGARPPFPITPPTGFHRDIAAFHTRTL